jgi:hypothetical protein
MVLSTQDIRNYTGKLADFLVGADLNTLLESQGKIADYNKKITQMRSATSAFDKEFGERHTATTPFSLSNFAINQDILLLGFMMSYAFLTVVGLIVLYKNTQSIQNTAYGLFMSGILLLIIIAILLRAA